MSIAAAILAKLGLDTGAFKKDLKKAQADTNSFAKNFKENIEKFAGALGGTQIAQFVRGAVEGFKDIGNAVELSTEQLKELRRNASGLTKEQADELAGVSDSYRDFGDSAKGAIGKVILGLRESLKQGQSFREFFTEFQQKGFFGALLKPGQSLLGNIPKQFNQPEQPISAGITPEERLKIQEEAAQKAKKIQEENLKLRQKISDIDDDIVAKQQDAAEKQMDTAGKIAESERRIREIKSAQLTAADELTAAELRRKLALEDIRNEELRIQQIKEKADNIQAGPDARRQKKRDDRDRAQAEARAKRELDLEDRKGKADASRNLKGPSNLTVGSKLGLEPSADFKRLKKLQPIDVGPMQGPQLPSTGKLATSNDIGGVIKELRVIAANLGVKLP